MDGSGRQSGGGTIGAMLLAALLGACLTGFAYWPGLMSWDPIRQYREATVGPITDWHPPAMQWVWQRLLPIDRGPAPMLVLQLGGWWGGLALLAATMARRGRAGPGWGLLACGLLPLALADTGAILKDCVMGGALMLATGLIAMRHRDGRGAGEGRGLASGIAAGALLLFAATLRFNAFCACLPLLLVLLPAAWRATWPRLLLAAALGTGLLMAAMPVANRLIGAEPSHVSLSLVIFDLGGITEQSGVNAFPPEIAVPDAVRANRRCYSPNKWDSYSDWVEPECPLGFSAWTDEDVAPALHPTSWWLRQILTHPFAYAAHRLHHFAINTRLLPLADSIERPVPAKDAPNEWGFRITPNPVLAALDGLAVATAHTPAGWPIVWIAMALGALIAGRGTRTAWLTMPVAASSFLYGLGYLPFSVASELRYHLWTGVAALLAVVLVIADREEIPRRRLILATLPTIFVTLAALALRV